MRSPAAVLLACATCVASAVAGDRVSVRRVEAIEGPRTVVRIHLSAPLAGRATARAIPKGAGRPDRLAIDLPGADLSDKASRTAEVGWGGVRRMRLGMPDARTARLVLDLDRPLAFDLAHEGSTVSVTLRE